MTNASDRAGTGPSPALCPLCGRSNACGQLAGASECWCMTTKIAAAALEAVPIEMRNRACICQACARKAAAGTVGA
ncbi:MAG TPA: cysteine-rich CWC family protein [Vicinamibacterales bacterium]